MDPLDYLRIAKRRAKLIVATTALGLLVGWVTLPAQDPATPAVPAEEDDALYSATHTLIVDSPGSSDTTQRGASPFQSLQSTAVYVTSGDVPVRAAQALGNPDPTALTQQVSTVVDASVGTIAITATGSEEEQVTAVADTFATELLRFLQERAQATQAADLAAANARLAELEQQITALGGSVTDVPAARGEPESIPDVQRAALLQEYGVLYERTRQLSGQTPTAGLKTLAAATPRLGLPSTLPVEPAVGADGKIDDPAVAAQPTEEATEPAPAPERATRPARALRVALGGLLGLLLGLGLAIVVDRSDTRMRSKEEAEDAFGLPVIAEIPRVRGRRHRRGLAMLSRRGQLAAERYRLLRAALLRPSSEPLAAGLPAAGGNGSGEVTPNAQVLLVTSSGAGEGKTALSANLAAAFGEVGKSVLVLSLDLRNPGVHRLLGVPNEQGLSQVLTGVHDLSLEDVTRPTAAPGVWVAPSGARVDNPAALLDNAAVVIEAARRRADVVLVDTAPLLLTSDAAELLPAADGVLVACRAGVTTREAATQMSEYLAQLSASVLGVVLLNAPLARSHGASRYVHRYVARGPRRREVVALNTRPIPGPQPAREPTTVEQHG